MAGMLQSIVRPVHAAAGINNQVHFQGKVVDKTTGTNIPNGSYGFVFNVYNVSSGGSTLWTESKSITVTDGIFQTFLGDVTPLPGSIDFNSDELYVGVNFNSDGEMTPRIRLSAVPYAMNATKVSGLSVTNTTGTLTIPNSKTVNFTDAFTTSGANPLTLTTTGTTSIVLPTTGTLMTLLGAEVLTNKTIGSTGLVFSGATTDITSGTNESIVIDANGAGGLFFNDVTTIGANSALIITGAAGDPTATNGTVWYDTTANKFKVVENTAIKILCNTTDLGCSGSSSISSLTPAIGVNTIDNTSHAQTWTWNSATTQTALSMNGSSLTSGGLLALNSSAAANFTGSLVSIGLTDGTGASSNTGTALTITNTGTANSNTALTIQNNATGTNSLSLQVNDEASDTTPTVIDSYGRLGLGTATPQSLLKVGSGSNNGDISLYGDVTKEGYSRLHSLANVIDVYIYQTNNDSDRGDWVWRTANNSWATETKDDGPGDPCVVATDDRCGRNMFPEKAILVTTTTGFYIFDAKDNGLWMKFTQDGAYSLGADSNNNPSGVFAMNGVVYVGTNGSSGSGMYAFDFINDTMYRYNTTDRVSAVENIANRNTTVSYSLNSMIAYAIVDNIVNDVHANVTVSSNSTNALNGVTMIGAATDTGVSIIKKGKGTISYSDVTDDDYNAVYITRRGRMYAVNETQLQAERWDNVDTEQASKLNTAVNKFWDQSSIPSLSKSSITIPTSPDILEVIELGSFATNTDDILYVGTGQGLTEIHNATNGWSRFITNSYSTDLMPVTIRGMFGFDDASGDATDYSFRNNVLQPMGNITYRADGVRGRSVTFDGASPTKFCSDTNNDGTCDVDTDFNPGTFPFNISFWFKRSGNPPLNETFVDKTFTTAGVVDTGRYGIYLITDGTVSFGIDDDTTGFPEDSAASTTEYTDGEWHFVFASKTTSAMQLFIDGKLVGEDTSLSATGALGTAGIFAVGAQCTSGANCTTGNSWLEGSMDELRVSMGGSGTIDVLTASQVNQIYNVGRAALNKRDISVTDATTTSTTTIGDSGETWIHGEFSGLVVELTGGTGSGQTRQVVSNTATTLTVYPAWTVTPDTTTDFAIKPEMLFGSSNNVTSIHIEKPVNFGLGYKVYAGTNDGAGGGGVTVFNNQSFVQTDVFHSDAGKVDAYGNAWTGSGADNIQGISSAGNTVAFGSGALQWAETAAFTVQGLSDQYVRFAENFRAETLRDTITGLGLEIGMLGGADLAEYYDSEQLLRPGDIVALVGEGAPQNVTKTSTAYDMRSIGVVATQPGMILGTKENNSYPVALVGRVPVNVTTENGFIKAGDQITSASTAGYGMLADQAGIVIGKSLEDLSAEKLTMCPDSVSDPQVQCGQVMVFVNLSQSLGVPIEAMIDRNPRVILQGAEETVVSEPSMLTTATSDQQSILQRLTGDLRRRLSNASGSALPAQTLRIDRVQANQDIIAPNIIADMVIARSIRADKIEGLEIYTNRLDTLSQDLIDQMNSLRSRNATGSASTASSSAALSSEALSDAEILGTILKSDGLEVQGLVVEGKATFKDESFFDKVVQFAAKVIFSEDIDVKGLTYLAEDSIGEALLPPNEEKTTVTFKTPYEFPPIVSVTMNIDWTKLDPDTQKILTAALSKGQLQYYVIDRTTDNFTISIRQPINVPLSFTWTAWPVRDDFMPMLSSPGPTLLNINTPPQSSISASASPSATPLLPNTTVQEP